MSFCLPEPVYFAIYSLNFFPLLKFDMVENPYSIMTMFSTRHQTCICVCSCLLLAADCNCASPEGTGTRDPYANSSKPFASQSNDGTAAESIRLDLSDRGNRRKASRSKAAIEAVKQAPAEQTQLRQRSVTTGSSDDDGAYIPPSEIASYPVPMPRKATSNAKPPPVSKGNDLYLQM